MNLSPVIIVDDDDDEGFLLRSVCHHLNIERPILTFSSGDELIKYLSDGNPPPILILSDMNMLTESGLETLRRILSHEEIRFHSIPFVLWSTSVSEAQIRQAYSAPVQGFFLKPRTFDDLCTTVQDIFNYWSRALHPKPVV